GLGKGYRIGDKLAATREVRDVPYSKPADAQDRQIKSLLCSASVISGSVDLSATIRNRRSRAWNLSLRFIFSCSGMLNRGRRATSLQSSRTSRNKGMTCVCFAGNGRSPETSGASSRSSNGQDQPASALTLSQSQFPFVNINGKP